MKYRILQSLIDQPYFLRFIDNIEKDSQDSQDGHYVSQEQPRIPFHDIH